MLTSSFSKWWSSTHFSWFTLRFFFLTKFMTSLPLDSLSTILNVTCTSFSLSFFHPLYFLVAVFFFFNYFFASFCKQFSDIYRIYRKISFKSKIFSLDTTWYKNRHLERQLQRNCNILFYFILMKENKFENIFIRQIHDTPLTNSWTPEGFHQPQI